MLARAIGGCDRASKMPTASAHPDLPARTKSAFQRVREKQKRRVTVRSLWFTFPISYPQVLPSRLSLQKVKRVGGRDGG